MEDTLEIREKIQKDFLIMEGLLNSQENETTKKKLQNQLKIFNNNLK